MAAVDVNNTTDICRSAGIVANKTSLLSANVASIRVVARLHRNESLTTTPQRDGEWKLKQRPRELTKTRRGTEVYRQTEEYEQKISNETVCAQQRDCPARMLGHCFRGSTLCLLIFFKLRNYFFLLLFFLPAFLLYVYAICERKPLTKSRQFRILFTDARKLTRFFSRKWFIHSEITRNYLYRPKIWNLYDLSSYIAHSRVVPKHTFLNILAEIFSAIRKPRCLSKLSVTIVQYKILYYYIIISFHYILLAYTSTLYLLFARSLPCVCTKLLSLEFHRELVLAQYHRSQSMKRFPSDRSIERERETFRGTF